MINLSWRPRRATRGRLIVEGPALGHVWRSASEVLLNRLHLVFDAQFELFETDFFQLFVFRQVSFFDERAETLRVLAVFLGQPTKLFVAGKKLFANGIYHPEEPPACSFTKR